MREALRHGKNEPPSEPVIGSEHIRWSLRETVSLSQWSDRSHRSVQSISDTIDIELKLTNAENIRAIIIGRYRDLRDVEEVESFPLHFVLAAARSNCREYQLLR